MGTVSKVHPHFALAESGFFVQGIFKASYESLSTTLQKSS